MSSPIDPGALGERLVSRFGSDGVRRFDAPSDPQPGLVLPLQVGPYFHTLPEEPGDLPGYAAQRGADLPTGDDWRQWARLGSDRAREFVVDPADGQVRTLVLGELEEPLSGPVNSTVQAFLATLLELDELLGALGNAEEPDQAARACDRFQENLRRRDPAALEDRESWWSQVLDDIRDTTAVAASAAFEILDDDGEKQIFTALGEPCVHPEERLWSALEAAGIRPEQVQRIYTELEACDLPGHYCALWLTLTFPTAALTHSFDYGDSAQSRADGIRELKAAIAEREEKGE